MGPTSAVSKTYINQVGDGVLDIELTASKDQSKLSGLEVFALDRGTHQYFNASWNLIGLPVTPVDNNYTSVLDEVAPDFSPFGYNGSAYEETTTMNGGEAYWVSVPAAGVQAYPGGTPATSITYALDSGWRLIAGPSCDFALADATGDTGIIEANTLFGYSQSSGYTESTSLMQGYGYWIRTNAAGSVTMDCAAASKQSVTAISPENPATTLTLRDALGYTQTLYLHENAAPGMYLPPRAPKGQVDVRFAHDSRLLTAPTGTIIVQGLPAPVSIALSETAQQAYVLEDVATGNSVHLHPGDAQTLAGFANGQLHINTNQPASNTLPDAFNLRGAYPNPFANRASIAFDTPHDAQVSVDVYDMLGRRVQSIAPVAVDAGMNRSIDIERGALAAGVYVYRLTVISSKTIESVSGQFVLMQ